MKFIGEKASCVIPLDGLAGRVAALYQAFDRRRLANSAYSRDIRASGLISD
jgi:hypothetical protein